MTDPTRIYDDQHNNAPAVPQGYEIHEIPADYSGLVWLEGQVRAVARRAQAATGPQGWTDADSDAARLALELECLLMDTKDLSVVSKWWGSANDALELHRQRLAATPAPAPAPFAPDWAGYRQGLEDGVQSAADLLKRMAVELVTERGETDPDTGAIQFKSAATREWHASLCELAEEIERLKPAKPAQEVGLTDGWISVGDRLPDGELGYPAIEFYNEDLRNPTRQVIGIYRDGDWFSGGHQFSNVTYWKPLTPAPLAALRAKGGK